jgi:hypothetical protein
MLIFLKKPQDSVILGMMGSKSQKLTTFKKEECPVLKNLQCHTGVQILI